jgi:hypothetical protein
MPYNVSRISGSVALTLYEGYDPSPTVVNEVERLEAEGYDLDRSQLDLDRLVLTRGPEDRAIVKTVKRREEYDLLTADEQRQVDDAWLVYWEEKTHP